jgi:hypothetical protein
MFSREELESPVSAMGLLSPAGFARTLLNFALSAIPILAPAFWNPAPYEWVMPPTRGRQVTRVAGLRFTHWREPLGTPNLTARRIHPDRDEIRTCPGSKPAAQTRDGYQKKYLSESTRKSVVTGRISTRQTEAYSVQGPSISASQITSDLKRGPVISR